MNQAAIFTEKRIANFVKLTPLRPRSPYNRTWATSNDHLPTALLLLRGVASPLVKVPLKSDTGTFWLKKATTRGAIRLQDRDLQIKQTIPQIRTEVEKAINERIKKGGKVVDHGPMPFEEAQTRFGDQVMSLFLGKWQVHNLKLIEIEGLIAAYVPKDWEFVGDIKDLQQVQIWQCRIKDVKKEVILDVQVYPDGDRQVPWKRLPKRVPRFNHFPNLLLKPKPQSSKNSRRCNHEDMLDNFGAFY